MKKDNDNPLGDIWASIRHAFSNLLVIPFFALYLLIIIGGIHWLWLAIQLKIFWMFCIGVIPFLWFITAPVGAYALIIDTPKWVYSLFA
ncbi:hypothetical protein BGC07_11715 [Piscirickettsia litoralis]|uniref:Uncharacterized protein n=2 Tax=Piscirickettsia litoralis TaxID=1891921 RepID=A0ABX3A3L7_9GAMM|nr:hypothetical protein BGC07_11715 [Piscirickettsia litoralis]